MTLEAIVHAVEVKHPELNRQEARAVATDIYYSGEQPDAILASSSTMDKLVNGFRARQAASENSVVANDPTICPVCKLPLKPVKLASERNAVFCQKHFVVFPVLPKAEGK